MPIHPCSPLSAYSLLSTTVRRSVTFGCLMAGLFVTVQTTHANGGTDVPDFALLDHQHQFHQFSKYRQHKALVLSVQLPDCEAVKQQSAQLTNLQQSYDGQAVTFALLNTNQASADDIRRQAKACGIEQPVLIDEAQLVAQQLELTRTGETLILDPVSSRIVYRGPLAADSMARTLNELVEGNSPAPATLAYTEGTAIEFNPLLSQKISYQNDVAPILKNRCAECHREGGIAPWAMNSHAMVKGWSAMMRETLLTRRMPPGQIDTSVGDWVDLHEITPAEKATLVSWIDAGAPKDGSHDPLTGVKPSTTEWALGEPDLVVDFPPEKMPATGVIDYLYKKVELNLEEDKWVKSLAFNVGDRAALHHVLVYVQDISDDSMNIAGQALIGFYVPGKSEVQFADDVGFFLGKDKRLLLQMHYTTYGKESMDETEFGLYFHDEPPAMALRTKVTMNAGFKIPPGSSNYEVTAATVIEEDSYLHSFAPHMHMRGKNVNYKAVYPDGREELLIAVPDYQFNWQMNYQLKEPVFLPAGTKIVTDGAFDNSTLNAFNPDSSAEVTWGEQSWEEMFLHFMGIAKAYEGTPDY